MNRHRDEGPIVTFTDQWGAKDDESLLAAPLGHRWHEYCRYREAAERAAAKRASSVQAQRIHQELAQAYATAARQEDSRC
jgi:hypothetical protein